MSSPVNLVGLLAVAGACVFLKVIFSKKARVAKTSEVYVGNYIPTVSDMGVPGGYREWDFNILRQPTGRS